MKDDILNHFIAARKILREKALPKGVRTIFIGKQAYMDHGGTEDVWAELRKRGGFTTRLASGSVVTLIPIEDGDSIQGFSYDSVEIDGQLQRREQP